MLKNPYVRIAIVIALAILLYYLVISFARGVAAAEVDPENTMQGKSLVE